MGLHLNYELRLDASTPEEVVVEKLRQLQAYASSLPLASVSPFVSEATAESDEEQRWLARLQWWAGIVATPTEDDEFPLQGEEFSVQGFWVNPGEGSEPASFALQRRYDVSGVLADWYWCCYCKTQYASTVSDEHFVTVHTALVRVLDEAVRLGIQADVVDEASYWETRDEARLLSEVQTMNRLVARIAGKLSDAIGNGHDVRASIFEHPQFEHLEMDQDDEV